MSPKQGYVEVIFGGWLGLGAQFVFIAVAVVIVMGIAAKLRNLWWTLAVPVSSGWWRSARCCPPT